jgi:hypothetical protein
MARLRAFVTLAFALGCGGSVEAGGVRDQPSEPVAEPEGTLAGTVTVRLGPDRYHVAIQPVATSVMLFPIQPFRQDPKTQATPIGSAVAVTESSPLGRYSLRAPPGTYTLIVRYEGYSEPLTTGPRGWSAVQLSASETTFQDIQIQRNHDF